jgi:hypothetical protein
MLKTFEMRERCTGKAAVGFFDGVPLPESHGKRLTNAGRHVGARDKYYSPHSAGHLKEESAKNLSTKWAAVTRHMLDGHGEGLICADR